MTLRGDGRPSDERSQAHPLEAEPRPVAPPPSRAPTTSRSGGRNGSRDSGRSNYRTANGRPHDGHGFLRFGLFTLAMVVVVVALFATVLRPVAAAAMAGWAVDNPATWRLPFIAGIVEEALADDLTTKAGDDPTPVVWAVREGDTVETVGDRLIADGLVASRPAFEWAAMDARLGERLQAGDFRLRHDMTPPEVVRALVEDRVVITTADVTFREGLRLEQMTAKLQTVASRVDSEAFYDLVTEPTEALLADYPWLELPDGATLEGYLYPATYTLRTDDEDPTDAEDLVRMMLDEFEDEVGEARLQAAADSPLGVRGVLTLASIVEKEAVLDDERARIAGVYQTRLDRELLLGADPTVIYAADGAALDAAPFSDWQSYFFGKVPAGPLRDVELPEKWAPWNTYMLRGLPPGPIASPTVASIDAALAPDVSDGYLFFVAIPDGDGKHDFSKNLEEHEEKLRKYGYL